MEDEPANLSNIPTLWGLVREAHGGPAPAVQAAQKVLLDRYSQAISRYLRAALRDADAAEEVFQEFALRFVRGDFRDVSPERGSFRRYVKRVLSNLVNDHHRKRGRPALSLDAVGLEPADSDPGLAETDSAFTDAWRRQLIRRSWEALEEEERTSGQPFYSVLRARTENPDERSADLAERLTASLGKRVSAEWVRNRLHFARDRFVELLLDEASSCLHEPSVEKLEEEIADLGLLEQCRSALQRRRGSN